MTQLKLKTLARPLEKIWRNEMDMKHWLIYIAGVLAITIIILWIIPWSSDVEEIKPQPPHILFILADDLGFSDVPWHNTAVEAPGILGLARTGVILEQHYTHSLCSPSRAAILSGKYAFETGRQDLLLSLQPTGLNLSLVLLPQYLKELGYAAYAVGKWHLGFCNWDYTPTERGFDSFFGFYNGAEDYYEKEFHEYVGSTGFDFRNEKEVYFQAKGNYSMFQYSDRVKEILDSSPPSVPKFIYLSVQNVHRPLAVPGVYLRSYNYISDHDRKTTLAMVTAMDDGILDVVEKLKETGHYENTVIIFISDNGGMPGSGSYNWPLRGRKTTLYDGGNRVPAFVHSPLLSSGGTTSNALIHAVDWLPTIISLAGGTPPNDTISGLDQWPMIAGETNGTIRKEMVYEITYASNSTSLAAAIRDEQYKLIIGKAGDGNWHLPPEYEFLTESKRRRKRSVSRTSSSQKTTFLPLEPFDEFNGDGIGYGLYDLIEDPEERFDLSGKLPYVVRRLAKRLHSYKDRYVVPDSPSLDMSGDPANFNGVWSPGFC